MIAELHLMSDDWNESNATRSSGNVSSYRNVPDYRFVLLSIGRTGWVEQKKENYSNYSS